MSNQGFNALEQLCELDPERYTACLYLPEKTRLSAAVIYLFDAEISRIPDLISEPMPGEIRLQFWRDIITNVAAKDMGPLAGALLEVIDKHKLPQEIFHNYLNARIFDLYHDPMPNLGTYEGYIGETHSALLLSVALCAGLEKNSQLADVCGHAGMAFGLTRMLSSLSWHHHNARIYVPAEIIHKHGLTQETWLREVPDQRHRAVLHEMLSLTRSHERKANRLIAKLDKESKQIFLPLAFVDPLLNKVEKTDLKIFTEPVKLGSLRRQWQSLKWAIRT